MYDLLGYYQVCYLGDEVIDPGRTLPRAILTSALERVRSGGRLLYSIKSTRLLLQQEATVRKVRSAMQQPTLMQAATPDVLLQFAPIIIIGAIFYLLIFMPMRKKQKKLEAMIGALRNGDKV